MLPKNSRKEEPSASSSQLEDQTKDQTDTERIPSLLLKPSKPKAGTQKSSNLKITELKKSTTMSLIDSQATLEESIQDPCLTMKKFSLKLSEECQKEDLSA